MFCSVLKYEIDAAYEKPSFCFLGWRQLEGQLSPIAGQVGKIKKWFSLKSTFSN